MQVVGITTIQILTFTTVLLDIGESTIYFYLRHYFFFFYLTEEFLTNVASFQKKYKCAFNKNFNFVATLWLMCFSCKLIVYFLLEYFVKLTIENNFDLLPFLLNMQWQNQNEDSLSSFQISQ